METSSMMLAKGKTVAWEVLGSGEVLHCATGWLWLTLTGDPEDHVLGPGEGMILKPGRWVAQALETARFQRVLRPLAKEVDHGQTNVLPVLQRV